jgi:hypothetical protein
MEIEFRIGTKVEGIEGESRWRNFSLVGIFYKDETIDSYTFIHPFHKEENIEDMQNWFAEIATAMQKPIIDLDNFPNIYEQIASTNSIN